MASFVSAQSLSDAARWEARSFRRAGSPASGGSCAAPEVVLDDEDDVLAEILVDDAQRPEGLGVTGPVARFGDEVDDAVPEQLQLATRLRQRVALPRPRVAVPTRRPDFAEVGFALPREERAEFLQHLRDVVDELLNRQPVVRMQVRVGRDLADPLLCDRVDRLTQGGAQRRYPRGHRISVPKGRCFYRGSAGKDITRGAGCQR